VIIYRIEVVECGGTSVNAGVITATAQTDGTVTAQINIGSGQTEMAIFGIPSIQTGYMRRWCVNAHNTSSPVTATQVDFNLWVNPFPDTDSSCYLKKGNMGTVSTGGVSITRDYAPYFKITGPAIIKIQGESSGNDIEASAEFDMIMVDN
jgi:hypothetical protein